MVHGCCSYGVAHCFLKVLGGEPLHGLATTKICLFIYSNKITKNQKSTDN